jgi:hypothetical protein
MASHGGERVDNWDQQDVTDAEEIDEEEEHEVLPVARERDTSFSVQLPDRRPRRVTRMSNEDRKREQTFIIKELTELLDATDLSTTENTKLDHITQTVNILTEIRTSEVNVLPRECLNIDNASKGLKVVVWWFLGYDKEATIDTFFIRYCQRMKLFNQDDRDAEWQKCATKHAQTTKNLHGSIKNLPESDNLTTLVASELCKQTAKYFQTYRLNQIKANSKTKFTKIARKYPEFEYWFWHTLQSLPAQDIKKYHMENFMSITTGKELAFEMVNQENRIHSNVEYCMSYFCENSYDENKVLQHGGPFGMMVHILFNSKVLEIFLNKIYLGILHDPKNPRDYINSTYKLQQEKESVQKERLQKIKEDAKMARMRTAAKRAEVSQELTILTNVVQPATIWTTNLKRFVYDYFSFHDVKYYEEFADPADIPAIKLSSELTYMYRTDEPKLDDNYYENDLFDALAKSLKVDIYQELIKKIQDNNAIAWLIHNDSFRQTLLIANYTTPNTAYADREYELKGNKFTKQLNMSSPDWDRNKIRLRGTFEMLDWVAKTLNKFIRVISLNNPSEKQDNISIDTLNSQAKEINQLANSNANTEDPTTYLMSNDKTEWTWNAHYEVRDRNSSDFTEQVVRISKEPGEVPSLGDDYLVKNQKDILYLFYETTSNFEQLFYGLKPCTKDEYDDYFKHFEQRQKEKQEAIQQEAVKHENECAKKFPLVANVLFGTFYSMLNITNGKAERDDTWQKYYWPAPFEMLYSVELKYVLAKIMQEISENKVQAADIASADLLKKNILLHILMSLTGTRSKTQIWDSFQKWRNYEKVDNHIDKNIEEMCTRILELKDGNISLCLNQLIQTSSVVLQEAPKFTKYLRREWKASANRMHVNNLKNKIELIKAYLKEIIKDWCMTYCTDDQWKKWVTSILECNTSVLIKINKEDCKEDFIINLTDNEQVPLFEDKETRMKATERVLKFGFHLSELTDTYDYKSQCYIYTEEDKEKIKDMVKQTASDLHKLKNNEQKNKEKLLHNSQHEGVVFRENAWSNGLPPSLQNSAAPRAVDTQAQERITLKQLALQERRKREEARRQQLNGNRPNPPNKLPPVPGALPRPEGSEESEESGVLPRYVTDWLKNVTQLTRFQHCLVEIMQAIVTFKTDYPQLKEITEEFAEIFCYATIMPLYSWIFGKHTYTETAAKAWCYEFLKEEKQLSTYLQRLFAMKTSIIIQQNNFSFLKTLIVNVISDVCQQLINNSSNRDTVTFENWLKSIVWVNEGTPIEQVFGDISRYLKFHCNNNFIENRVEFLVRKLLLDDAERERFYANVRQHKVPDFELEIESEYFPFDREKHKLIEISQNRGHSLYAAVAQVLYHGATPAVIAQQHIWELRHGAAWMWLQYWRENAGHAKCSIDAMWKYYLEILYVPGTPFIYVHAGSLAIEMLSNYIQRSIEVYERVKNGNETQYKLVTIYCPTVAIDKLYDPIKLVRSPPDGSHKIFDFDPRNPKSYNIAPEDRQVEIADEQNPSKITYELAGNIDGYSSEIFLNLKYHYDVIVPLEDVSKSGRPQKLLFKLDPETNQYTQTPLDQRIRWKRGKHVRGILRLFQWLLCDSELLKQTREHPVDARQRRTDYSVEAFMTRKWDNIFAQLKTQLTTLQDTQDRPLKTQIQTMFWNLLIQIYTFAEDDEQTYFFSEHLDRHYNVQDLVKMQYEIFMGLRDTFMGVHRVNNFDFFKFQETEADKEHLVISLNIVHDFPPVPATNPDLVREDYTWAIMLKDKINAAGDRRDLYQAFIDIFCSIFNAHKEVRDAQMDDIFDECSEMQDFCNMKHWKDVIDLAMEIWAEILNTFCDVCDKAQSNNEFTKDLDGKQTTIFWTKKEDMYKVNTTENKPLFLFLPLFELTFSTNDSQKPFSKAIFEQTTSTWFERLKKQTMECWMQKLFEQYPIIADQKYDCFFYIKLKKIDIINFVKGELVSVTKNGQIKQHKFCLPANCFEQKDENGDDVSDQDKELQDFKHQFFSKDKTITRLCKAIFRLRKICAFCREAKKYEIFDDSTRERTGYDEERIKKLEDSRNESEFIEVTAANITGNTSWNDYFVSHAPLLTDIDSRGTYDDLYLQTNQFFV